MCARPWRELTVSQRIGRIADVWLLIEELDDAGDEYEAVDDGSRDSPLACPWCGGPVWDSYELDLDEEEWTPAERARFDQCWIALTMKDYWGPLKFMEDRDGLYRVGLLVADAWRWLELGRPYRADEPYRLYGRACSTRCFTFFLAALRRDTAERRPQ